MTTFVKLPETIAYSQDKQKESRIQLGGVSNLLNLKTSPKICPYCSFSWRLLQSLRGIP